MKHLRIITCSGPDRDNLLPSRIAELKAAGFNVTTDLCTTPSSFPTLMAGSIQERLKSLSDALCDDSVDVILCARGSYGASDLLPLLRWTEIAKALQRKPKMIVGFSDISAVHSAMYHVLKNPGLHAPMPATQLWSKTGDDVKLLLDILNQKKSSWKIPLLTKASQKVSGKLFGGNLAVLSNLIGTAFLPNHFSEHILFFEEVGENPGRILRYFNQWIQAGLLVGVRAIVWGQCTGMGTQFPDNQPELFTELAARATHVPHFRSLAFGHVTPNLCLPVGGVAEISENEMVCRGVP